MSNQQSMSSPEHSSHQQQQERLYNDDPREQYAQQHSQERASGEGSYEEGYQGYTAPYLEGEKLRPAPPPALQGWKIVLIILVIALVVTGGGGGSSRAVEHSPGSVAVFSCKTARHFRYRPFMGVAIAMAADRGSSRSRSEVFRTQQA